jgi:4-hydroxy-2-oxoheptanedioate aldolase
MLIDRRKYTDRTRIDLIFIGPNDLALALLGYVPAKGTEPAFVEAIDKIVAAARKHGKKTGTLVLDGEAAKKAKERFDLVTIGTEVRAMQSWYGTHLKAAKL